MPERLQALQRSVEIRESARQWRTPTWCRIEKEVKLWRRRRQQRRSELALLRQNAAHDRKVHFRRKRKRRKCFFKTSKFWRHLQSQVNSEYFGESRRRTAGQSWKDDRSTRAQVSPFESDSKRSDGSVSATATDDPISLATSAPLNREIPLMALAQAGRAQSEGRTAGRGEFAATSSSASHTNKLGPTMTDSSQEKKPSSISSLSEEAHLHRKETTTPTSSNRTR